MGGRRDDRGSATLFTLAAIAVVFLLVGALTVLLSYVGAARRAGQAADLAALSAARTVAFGEPGCPIAERIARDNGALMVDCAQVGDAIEFAVTVEVRAAVGRRMPGLPTSAHGKASAGQMDSS